MFNPKSLSGSRIIAIIFLSVLLTACTVADYKKPVGDFSAVVKRAETTLKEFNQKVTSKYQENALKKLLADKPSAEEREEGGKLDCLASSTRCRLVFLNSKNEELKRPGSAMRRMIGLMNSFRMYADNLNKIVEDTTAAQVEVSVNETISSLGQLENTVNRFGGEIKKSDGKIQEIVAPVGLVLNWVVGKYIAKVKIEALRRATRNAKNVVEEATKLFEEAARVAEYSYKIDLKNEFSNHKNKFNDNPSKQHFQELVKAAEKFDIFLRGRPSRVFARLRDTHNSLADNLQNGEVTLAEVYGKTSILRTEMEKLAKIVKESPKKN